ncbi:putative D-xylulose kinase A [Fusarium oxysporum f. sp. albedinis]|nr:putative D-xylulose kinase A [Fusarium oxysporum f. sp. albedinis]
MLHLVLFEAALWYDKPKPTLPLDWGLARLLGEAIGAIEQTIDICTLKAEEKVQGSVFRGAHNLKGQEEGSTLIKTTTHEIWTMLRRL